MINLACVAFVFVLGFGWGAAAMVIPMHKKIKRCIEAVLALVDICGTVADTQGKELEALKRLSKDCGGVISGTAGVIEGVDKLIEEIGHEV